MSLHVVYSNSIVYSIIVYSILKKCYIHVPETSVAVT